MGSTRLPGKSLKPLYDHSVLEWVIERASSAQSLNQVIIATTEEERDRAIINVARVHGIPTFIGSESDVMGRVVKCAAAFDVDVIVDITADCPFVDPRHIDILVSLHRANDCHYTSNVLTRMWPDGCDIQVYNSNVLHELYYEESPPHIILEHSGWNITRFPNQYRLQNHNAPPEFNDPELRLTLDTSEDYLFLNDVAEAMVTQYGNRLFPIEDAIRYARNG